MSSRPQQTNQDDFSKGVATSSWGFKKKIVPLQKTTPAQEEHDLYWDSVSSKGEKYDSTMSEHKSSLSISIRTCSISMFLVIILVCVLLLTAIWVAFFSSNVTDMSKSLTTTQFEKIIQFTERTFGDIVIASDSIKQQLIVTLSKNHSDIFSKEAYRAIDNVYFSVIKYHQGFVNWAALHDRHDNNIGILFTPVFPVCRTVQVPHVKIDRYPCEILTPEEGCVPKDYIHSINTTGPYNTENAKEMIRRFPGKPSFTPSYVSPGIDAVLILLVNSYASPYNSSASPDLPFDWFFTLDMSVENMSNFLKNATASIIGSVGMIMETHTKYIIATSVPEVKVSGRISPSEHNSTLVSGVYNQMYRELPNYQQMQCNNIAFLTFSDRLTLVYRLCTEFNLDWIIVFSVPQWNYIGSMIIAIIIALSCSLLIALGGVAGGIVYSLLIVRPFQNLIELFEHVAHMNLDSMKINSSRFTEVGLLQSHFLLMVQRIKQYRAFIPAHLLHTLESNTSGEATPMVAHHDKPTDIMTEKTDLTSKLSTSTISAMNPQTNFMFKIGFEKRRISFVMIHLDGFHYCIKHVPIQEITHMLTDVFEIIQRVSGTNGAHVGSFNNDGVILSFNSTDKIKNHELKAVTTASTLREKIRAMKVSLWEKKDFMIQNPKVLKKFNVRFAICTQNSHCGNVGTKTSKAFSIVGSAVNNLHFIVKKAKQLDLSLVITEQTHSEISSNFLTRFIGLKRLMNEELIVSPLINGGSKRKEKTKLFEVGDSCAVEMDEWMYELQSKEQKNKWALYHQACEKFFNSQFEESLSLFNEFHMKHNQDLPTLKMIEKCEHLIKSH